MSWSCRRHSALTTCKIRLSERSNPIRRPRAARNSWRAPGSRGRMMERGWFIARGEEMRQSGCWPMSNVIPISKRNIALGRSFAPPSSPRSFHGVLTARPDSRSDLDWIPLRRGVPEAIVWIGRRGPNVGKIIDGTKQVPTSHGDHYALRCEAPGDFALDPLTLVGGWWDPLQTGHLPPRIHP